MIDYKNLKVGDVFYEAHQFGGPRKMTTKTVPEIEIVDMLGNEMVQWKWIAVDEDGKSVHYAITEKLEHYGPKLYYDGDVYES